MGEQVLFPGTDRPGALTVRGDEDAAAVSVEALQAEFAGPLLVYAMRRLGDPHVAEEVVQDTLLAAWRHGHRFDADRGSLAGWLFTIARNLIVDRGRRAGARPLTVSLVGDGAVEEGEIDRALEAWQLAQALAELSKDHLEAVVEVHYLGYTVRQASERLGVPVGTVKSRIYYGLQTLRLRLEEMGVIG